MIEIRKDYLLKRYVILATERAKRPNDFVQKNNNDSSPKETCPFCPENEAMVPKVFDEIKEGGKYKAKVLGVSEFGVFCEVEGVEGLIHISEISWEKVSNASNYVKAGDEVVTYGGIFAVVKDVEENWFIVTVADGVDIKVAKEAVVMRREAGTEDKAPA